MTRYAIIESNVVTSIVELNQITDWHTSTDLVIASNTAQVGDTFNGTTIVPQALATPTWAKYQATAKALLEDTSTTMERITGAVIRGANSYTSADVVAFENYREALRTIMNTSTGDPTQGFPVKPAYPYGT